MNTIVKFVKGLIKKKGLIVCEGCQPFRGWQPSLRVIDNKCILTNHVNGRPLLQNLLNGLSG